jgi:type II secretory pathway pseudopilin PulG
MEAPRSSNRNGFRSTGVNPWRSLDRKSQIANRKSAFTILELLTTLALIVIVLGLMVSLARYVRANSADQVTRRVLLELETQLDAYHARFKAYPAADVIAAQTSETGVAASIAAAAPGVATVLRIGPPQPGVSDLTALDLRDAWGRAIGYLPHHHPEIGMAPENRPFFFSAGPDGKYLTRQDNLYSYEQTRPTRLPPPVASGGGVDKANNAAGGE